MSGGALAEAINAATSRFVVGGGQTGPFDAGPVVVAALGGISSTTRAECAGVWMERFPDGASPLGLMDGAAGLLVGARALAGVDDRFTVLASRIATAVRLALEVSPPEGDVLHWHHYDLISGPSGAVLALEEASDGSPVVDDLIARASAKRPRFRVDVDADDDLISWNRGRVNIGLAHGVPGVLAALTRLQQPHSGTTERLSTAITRVLDWLLAQAYEDSDGLVVWDPGERHAGERPHGSRRQAWCYGVPGVAWTIWEAASVIDRRDAQDFAADAFARYAETFDPAVRLDEDPAEALAFCHGAAGILAVADAFQRAADLPAAARLADRLETILWQQVGRLDEVFGDNPSLLTGSSGVLAVLLARGGVDRQWLRSMALA